MRGPWKRSGLLWVAVAVLVWLGAVSTCSAQLVTFHDFDQCPDGWFRTPSGACLLLVINRTQVTWDVAEQACVNQGAHLAAASTLDDWLDVNETCVNSAQSDCWFGVRQLNNQGAPNLGWYWQDCMAELAVPFASLVPAVVTWRQEYQGNASQSEPNDYNLTDGSSGIERNNENCGKFEGGLLLDYVCSPVETYTPTTYVCGKSRYCSIHGTSLRTGTGSNATCKCICLPGFYGDGQTCEVCDKNGISKTFPNGTSTCVCESPYIGNGYTCYLPNPPTNAPTPAPAIGSLASGNQSSGGVGLAAGATPSMLALGVNCTSSNARLILQTNGSWQCECQPPSQGNGQICLLCDANAIAVPTANKSGLECQCNAGFQGSGLTCASVKKVNGSFVGLAVAFSVVCLVAFCCCFLLGLRFWKRRKRRAFFQVRESSSDPSGEEPYPGHPKVTVYSLRELERATSHWAGDNLLGIGSYGEVYRADFLDGSQGAVKRCRERSAKEGREFRNEVELLSRVHHQHLVQLLGYCTEQGERILVYEYMSEWNLRFNLAHDNGRPPLTWRQRLEAALGAAMGLSYLHEGADPHIIHRDVKPSNILLNAGMEAKVADFGISLAHRLGPQDHITTTIRGTPGYLDPDYLVTQQLTEKSDVYSFGVVLLEIITGRAVTDTSRPAKEVYLIRWAKQYLLTNQAPSIIESRIQGQFTDESAHTVAYWIAQCLAEFPEDRPSMSAVVEGLRDALRLEGWGSPSMNAQTPGSSRKIVEPGRQEDAEQVVITV